MLLFFFRLTPSQKFIGGFLIVICATFRVLSQVQGGKEDVYEKRFKLTLLHPTWLNKSIITQKWRKHVYGSRWYLHYVLHITKANTLSVNVWNKKKIF